MKKNELLSALWQYKTPLKYVGLFTACINLLYLVPSIYMLEVYDRVLTSYNLSTLTLLTLIVAFLFAIMSALEYVRSAVVIKIGEGLDNNLNQRIYTAAFLQNLKSKKINAGQAITDLTTIRQFVTGNGLFAFFDAPWFPIYLVVIFLFNFWMGLFALFSVVTLIALAWANEKLMQPHLEKANTFALQSGALATNNLRHADAIHAMGMLGSLRERWFSLHQQFLNSQAQGSMSAAYVTSLTKLFRLIMQSLILGLGALLAVKHEISPGMMIAGSILLGRALAPVDLIIGVWRQWGGVLTAYKRLNQLLADNPQPQSTFNLNKPLGNIELDAVGVLYDGVEDPSLRDITFKLDAGEILALIGQSGAGKSTLGKVIAGLIAPTYGKARLDTADIYEWNREDLGKYIGYLPQQPALLPGTVAENIARFSQQMDSEKVIAAAELAGVHELILRLPHGYETLVGEGGFGLSGGQLQRVALAQALFDDPALIILDEPNSNLDQASEQVLIETLQKLRSNGQTVICISHSTSLIRCSSKLLLLENGMIKVFESTQVALENMSAPSNPSASSGN